MMLSSKENNINNLLNDDRFIVWVTSNYIINNAYWLNVKAGLNKLDTEEFNKAVTILTKLRKLHIDDEKSLKSKSFIKQQYNNLIADYNSKAAIKKPKVFKLNSLLKYAAVLIISISITSIVFLLKGADNSFANNLVETNFNTSDLLIQTPNNKYYRISDNENKTWLNENGVLVSVSSEAISFTATDNLKATENSAYKIIVPKGKKYLLTLIDSTNVELNANTSITFNNALNSKQRKINLKGEAFFDVTHNKNRPFIVQSSDLKIEVLGTEFNVSNYEANQYTSTTLIDGSIKVSNQQGENQIIKPGTRATLYHNQSTIILKKVNVQKMVSWTVNRMIFEDETLERIIQKLNNWYDVKFNLEDESIKQYRFTGTLKKENTLTHFLQMLKYTENISYEIIGDEVTLFFNKSINN